MQFFFSHIAFHWCPKLSQILQNTSPTLRTMFTKALAGVPGFGLIVVVTIDEGVLDGSFAVSTLSDVDITVCVVDGPSVDDTFS